MWGGLPSIVLPRMRAAASTTLLVIAIVVVATTLVAAVPTYTDAVDRAALTLRLDETPSADRGVRITARAAASTSAAGLAEIEAAAFDVLPVDAPTLAFARSGGLEVDRPVPDGAVISLAALADAGQHVAILDQRASADRRGDEPDVAPATVHVDMAEALDLDLGDIIALSRGNETVSIVVDTLVAPIDRGADEWFSDPALRDGSESSSSFTEFAPFLLEWPVLARLDLDVGIEWRAAVGSSEIDFDRLDEIRAAAQELESLDAVDGVSGGIEVETELAGVLDDLRDELDAGRSVVLTVLVQAVAVALAATAIGGSVAAHARRREVELLRLRGASARQLVAVAAVESTIVAVPAVLAGPFAAVAVVGLVDDRGPLRTAGLSLDPAFSWQALIAAGLVGAIAVSLLVAPSVRAAFRLRAGALDRGRGDSWLLRNGVDVLLAGAAAAIIWRLSDAPAATRGTDGRLGADPLLVLAPGLAVLAGVFVALRIVRTGAGLFVRAARRRRALVMQLASASALRRPSATSRVSTLVVMAVGVGVFASMLAASWERSHVDRADALVSADAVVRFPPVRRPGAVEPPFRAAAILGVEGVDGAVPVDVQDGVMGSGTIETVVVATDAARFDEVATFTPQLRSGSAATVLGSQCLGGIELVAASTDEVVEVELTTSIVTATGTESVVARVLVSDRFGTLSSFEFESVPATGNDVTRRLSLGSEVVAGAGLAAPLHLVELEFVVPVPLLDVEEPVDGRLQVRVVELAVDGRAVDFADAELSIAPMSRPSGARAPFTAELFDAFSNPTVLVNPGASVARRATLSVGLFAGDRGAGDDGDGEAAAPPIPAIVSEALAARLGASLGDDVPLRVDGVVVPIRVTGVDESIPFAVDEPNVVMIDWGALQARRFVDTGRWRPPSQFAVAANATEVTEGLERAPLGLDGVVDRRALAREFADQPVDVALLGALLISGGAVVAIALIGLIMNAFVMAADRRTTSAYLRAMGVSRVDGRRWLVAEIAPVVAVSVAVGMATGVILARLGVDSLTLTEDGSPVVPPPVAVMPGSPVGFVMVLVGSAALLSPVAATRLLRRSRPSEELRAGAAR